MIFKQIHYSTKSALKRMQEELFILIYSTKSKVH